MGKIQLCSTQKKLPSILCRHQKHARPIAKLIWKIFKTVNKINLGHKWERFVNCYVQYNYYCLCVRWTFRLSTLKELFPLGQSPQGNNSLHVDNSRYSPHMNSKAIIVYCLVSSLIDSWLFNIHFQVQFLCLIYKYILLPTRLINVIHSIQECLCYCFHTVRFCLLKTKAFP